MAATQYKMNETNYNSYFSAELPYNNFVTTQVSKYIITLKQNGSLINNVVDQCLL